MDNMKQFVQKRLTKVQKRLFNMKFSQWKSPYSQIKSDQEIMMKTMADFRKKSKLVYKPSISRNRSKNPQKNKTSDRLSKTSVLHPIPVSIIARNNVSVSLLKIPKIS